MVAAKSVTRVSTVKVDPRGDFIGGSGDGETGYNLRVYKKIFK